MLAAVAIIYIMCMPMGYVVGMNYVRTRANRFEHTIDRETERKNLSFLPIMTGFLLPMAAILSIQEIMNGDFQ